MREEWPMAKWWERLIMLAFTLLFGWMLSWGLESTGPDVWPHVMIPPYGLWLYATAASLVNRRYLDVSPAGLVMGNGPIPLRPRTRIARDNVDFTYHAPILTSDDSGGTIVLWHTTGVETRSGRQIQLFGMFKDEETSRLTARRVAVALGKPVGSAPVDARPITALRWDPSDQRVGWVWTGLVAVAVVVGFVWDLVLRS